MSRRFSLAETMRILFLDKIKGGHTIMVISLIKIVTISKVSKPMGTTNMNKIAALRVKP